MQYITKLIEGKTYRHYFTYSCKKDAIKASIRLKEKYKKYKIKKINTTGMSNGFKYIEIIYNNYKFELWVNNKSFNKKIKETNECLFY
jgi:hypothetical protein